MATDRPTRPLGPKKLKQVLAARKHITGVGGGTILGQI
jgi:hypothetical protein